MNRNELLLWVVVVLLFGAQVFMISNTFNKIGSEEMLEAAQGPYLLSKGYVYGLYGNIGWYGLLLLVYKAVGFQLFTAKYVRLVIHAVAILSAALLLKKYMGTTKALVPMLVFGLSPTLLYFNTMTTTLGMDLDYIAIILFILSCISFRSNKKNYSIEFLFGAYVMFAWLSYGGFSLYIPFIALLYVLLLLFHKKTKVQLTHIVFPLAGAVILFVGMLLLLSNPMEVIGKTLHGMGLFRGNGSFQWNIALWLYNFSIIVNDLTRDGASYYFVLHKKELSYYYGLISIIAVIIGSIVVFRTKKSYRTLIALACGTALFALVVGNFIGPWGLGGIRRLTILIAVFCVLFAMTWKHIWALKSVWLRRCIVLSLLLLPLHHILVYTDNAEFIKKPNNSQRALFVTGSKPPEALYRSLLNELQNHDVQLACQDASGIVFECQYYEIFSALRLSCETNHLNCHNLYGYKEETKTFVPLSIDELRR